MPDLDSYFRWVINQRESHADFVRLTDDQDPLRVLFICGRGRCGKSRLLKWFASENHRYMIGDRPVEFTEHKNSQILIDDIAECFKDSGYQLPTYDKAENDLLRTFNAHVEHVVITDSPGAAVFANAGLGESQQLKPKNARTLLAALLKDLEAIDKRRSLKGYLLFDGFNDADPDTQRFFSTRVLQGLSHFTGLRFVVEDKPDLPSLEKNVILAESCDYRSTVLRYSVTVDDVTNFFEAKQPNGYPQEKWQSLAERYIERSHGYPDVVFSFLKGIMDV